MIHVPLGFGGELVEATFVARPNRFLVEALLNGELVQAHLADRGRLKETLVPGARLLLARNTGAGRKTQFQAVAAYRTAESGIDTTSVQSDSLLTSLDTQLPNRLIGMALQMGALVPFAQYPQVRREVKIGTSRFDFQLTDGERRCIVEVKSAGFIADGLALFPDAPTTRGRRHLEELGALAQAGEHTTVVFVIQGAARAVTVNTVIDPAFAATLRAVVAAGVEAYAYSCPLTREGLALGPQVPVLL